MMISVRPTPTTPVPPNLRLMVPNLSYALDFERLRVAKSNKATCREILGKLVVISI